MFIAKSCMKKDNCVCLCTQCLFTCHLCVRCYFIFVIETCFSGKYRQNVHELFKVKYGIKTNFLMFAKFCGSYRWGAKSIPHFAVLLTNEKRAISENQMLHVRGCTHIVKLIQFFGEKGDVGRIQVWNGRRFSNFNQIKKKQIDIAGKFSKKGVFFGFTGVGCPRLRNLPWQRGVTKWCGCYSNI